MPPVAVEAPAAPPAWTVPVGWKAETIPFPLEFAPGLAYRGVEELRFPPGFFKKGEERYFSYAFLWYVVAPGPADVEVLERDLVAYFEGLARAVGGAERADIAAAKFSAELSGSLASGVSGTVEAFDAFEAEAPVSLRLEAKTVTCAKAGLVAVVFVASPRMRTAGDAVWRELDALVSGLRC